MHCRPSSSSSYGLTGAVWLHPTAREVRHGLSRRHVHTPAVAGRPVTLHGEEVPFVVALRNVDTDQTRRGIKDSFTYGRAEGIGGHSRCTGAAATSGTAPQVSVAVVVSNTPDDADTDGIAGELGADEGRLVVGDGHARHTGGPTTVEAAFLARWTVAFLARFITCTNGIRVQ